METNNAIPVITINISKSPLWLNSVFVSADVSVIVTSPASDVYSVKLLTARMPPPAQNPPSSALFFNGARFGWCQVPAGQKA